MKLHLKVTAFVCAVLVVYGGVDYLVQRQVVLPGFETLERDLAHTDMQRVTHAVERELSEFQLFCADWGNWAATYRFAQDHSPTFITGNLTPSVIRSAKVDLVAVLDVDSGVIWQQSFDPVRGIEAPYRLLEGNALAADDPLRKAVAAGKPASGIVGTEFGPAMIVAAPILDGTLHGPQRGAMLLLRVITAAQVAELGKQAEVALTLLPAPVGGERGRSNAGPLRTVERATVNEVYSEVADVRGKHVLTWRIDVPRSISASGREAAHFAFYSLLTAGVVILLLLIEVIRRLILDPLIRITEHAVRIGGSDDLTPRLRLRRKDELGILAQELDRMVDRLAEARRHLAQQAFEAGRSEMMGGVLHNIGNALTPITVRCAGMQAVLAEVPAANVEIALAELETLQTDPQRRTDLQEFVRLAGIEACQAVDRLKSDTEALTLGVHAIHAILSQQAHSAGNTHVMEVVRLEELIRDSVRLVSPGRLANLELEIDESVARIGSLRLARITLQQVFQNIIINACEAMQTEVKGKLSISARLESPQSDRERLHLTFSDDGSGIDAENLLRIFAKGFSTKSAKINSGTGLHWTANAVNSLGGRIRVTSGGPGRGTQFFITLPLEQSTAGVGAVAA
jgi:two-component system, NtrC family, sensor kinase